MSASSPNRNRTRRAIFLSLFFIASALMFVGGIAALLYFLFSEYSGVRNIWILLCGAPVVLAALVIFIIFNLYIRFGKPLEELFNTINAVEEGNLAARVKENKSDMFSELFKRFNKMVGELERAEQQRRNLTADIAHELRTPLHIIQGNLEGIVDGVYQPTPEHIENTLEETRLLARLVNDLQTLSLAETKQLPLHPSRFALAELFRDLTSSFASQATSQNIKFKTTLSDPDQQITADYDRINQALVNLISNALRHTSSGGEIVIEAESIADEKKRARIKIQDTGSGIPSEDLPFIFDRFWRGEKSRTERTHSGLGLAITKQLILSHGGTIEVKSEQGIGTMFIIELP